MRMRTPLLLIAVLLTIVVLSPATEIANQTMEFESDYTPASFVSRNVLFDESHTANGSSLWVPGNASFFSWMLGENGYNSSTNFNESLDSGILAGYDILVIFFPMINLSAGELSAVESFVNNGGGLLLAGVDNENWYEYRNPFLNHISETYGITFNSDRMGETITDFDTHNITAGVDELVPDVDHPPDFSGCTLSLSGLATPVAYNGGGFPVVAYSEYGSGRVVGVGMVGPFVMYRHDTYGEGPSHFQFSLNVIDWLGKNPQRTAVVPETAVITVGNGPALSVSEVEEYTAFTGVYHEHTTHSDGSNTPEEMLSKGLEIGLDFMVMTDHSHSTPVSTGGMTGGLAMKEIAEDHSLDINVIPGAELSGVRHTAVFPLTSNIFTGDQAQAVALAHAQGAIAVLCHPTYGFNYMPTYEEFETLGYDAIEVDNSGFIYGTLEEGFKYPFLFASDLHSAPPMGDLLNVAFVKNPTGPNGRISNADLLSAILSKRIVGIDRINGLIYGQKIWVDRYLDLMTEAKSTVDSARLLIDGLQENSHSLSEAYLKASERALDVGSASRAINLANNATSSLVLGFNISAIAPDIYVLGEQASLRIELSNNHTFPISVNVSVSTQTYLTIEPTQGLLESPAKGTGSIALAADPGTWGLTVYAFNLHSFNTTEYLLPLILSGVGIIDHVTYEINQDGLQYEIDISFWIGRESSTALSSVTLHYDDGSGPKSIAMIRGWNDYSVTIGPYEAAEITFYVSVVTFTSEIYHLGAVTLSVGDIVTTTTTTTTSTTDTGTGPPPPEMMLLLAVGGGIAVVVVIVIIVSKRR